MKYNYKDIYDYKQSARRQLILFIISPFICLIDTFKGKHIKILMNVIWAYCAFHGFTAVIANEGVDSFRYSQQLVEAHNKPLNWDNFISTFFTEENVDIVFPLLNYIIALFTDNSRILFLAMGVIFGYFYSRNIGYLLKINSDKFSKSQLFMVIIFALIVPFWLINGFRMWTAAHIFFFAAVRIIDNKNMIKSLLILALAPLTHFSFVLPITVLLLYKVLGNRITVYYIFFVITFFISEINLDAFRDNALTVLPDLYTSKVDAYTNEQVALELENKQEELRFYVKYKWLIFRIGLFIFYIFLYIKRLSFKKSSPVAYNYFGFSLLFMGIANIMSLVPSGRRFVLISSLFALVCLVHLYNMNLRLKLSFLQRYIASLCFIFYGIFSIWEGFQFMSIMVVLGNPIVALFANLDFSLTQLVKLDF